MENGEQALVTPKLLWLVGAVVLAAAAGSCRLPVGGNTGVGLDDGTVGAVQVP